MVHLPVAFAGCLLLGSSAFAAQVAVGITNSKGASQGGVLIIPDKQVDQVSSNACRWLGGGECTSASKDGSVNRQMKDGSVMTKGKNTDTKTHSSTKGAVKSAQNPAAKVATDKRVKPAQKPTEKSKAWDVALSLGAGQSAQDVNSVADVLKKHGITVEKVITRKEDMPKQSKRWTA
ncbi:hypothetical protein K461DRAFT_293050 [Myriangium duriaei CBS 260.36]|uniref:DUF4189 domain-containing protein n=1 Tax=Myriangium duriaei CBS 260.36 TaxID=1168546 RepID=A0A9P4J8S1_9PEZI|nr:hypothetical protein K461DRAFT_293050 [Myriangium duriaei CBS 260.36]